MAKYLCFDSDGNCVQEGSCPDGQEHLQRPDLTTVIHEGNFLNSYLKNGIVKTCKNPPNEFSKFNVEQEKWVVDIEKTEKHAKNIRNSLLAKSDWTQAKDIPKNISEKWLSYRQHLRDVTQQSGFPITIDWGTPPNEV
jgi:hypothetical protein